MNPNRADDFYLLGEPHQDVHQFPFTCNPSIENMRLVDDAVRHAMSSYSLTNAARTLEKKGFEVIHTPDDTGTRAVVSPEDHPNCVYKLSTDSGAWANENEWDSYQLRTKFPGTDSARRLSNDILSLLAPTVAIQASEDPQWTVMYRGDTKLANRKDLSEIARSILRTEWLTEDLRLDNIAIIGDNAYLIDYPYLNHRERYIQQDRQRIIDKLQKKAES